MVFHWECVAQVDIFAPTALPTGSLVTHVQSFFSSVVLRNNRMLHFESLGFTCLTYCANNNVQRFRNGPVHEFYGFKASQMSQVRASSHEYTHVEKIRNLREENFKGTVAHNCHGKRINLTAKTMTSR